jgi:hypothetical protein
MARRRHHNTGRNPLEHTGGKASGRIRDLYTANPKLTTTDIHDTLGKEGLKCSRGLISGVLSKMRKKQKSEANETFTVHQLTSVKRLADEMGIKTLKQLVDILYGMESNRT